jgi:hypothetical protein
VTEDKHEMAEQLWQALNDERPFYVLDETDTVMRAATMMEFIVFRQSNRHRIADDRRDHWRVSTIFLGIPLPNTNTPTEMFETMVWLNGEHFDEHHTDTIEDARAMHAAQVERMLTRFGHSKSEHKRLAAHRRELRDAVADSLPTDDS